MSVDLASEETAVVATFSSRMQAEQARDHLEEAGIRALITADDAGGAHTDFQAAHGVRLSVLEGKADRAREVLAVHESKPRGSEEESEGIAPEGSVFTRSTAAIALAVIGAAFLVIAIGLLV